MQQGGDAFMEKMEALEKYKAKDTQMSISEEQAKLAALEEEQKRLEEELAKKREAQQAQLKEAEAARREAEAALEKKK